MGRQERRAIRVIGYQVGKMLREDAFHLFFMPSDSVPSGIADLKFCRRIQQSAPAKPAFIGEFGVILVGVEHRMDALHGVGRHGQTLIIER